MSSEKKEEMTFLEHLEELRWVIIRILVAIIVMATAAFFLKDWLFDSVLLAPRNPNFVSNRFLCHLGEILHSDGLCINQKPAQLQNISMGGQFNMHVWVSIIAGFILAFPYIFYQIWKFLAPALRPSELKYARNAVFFSSILFFTGILFGYYILLPFSIDFLTTYSVSDQIINQINFTSYISNITTVTLACGLVFELPIIVFFLSSIGIVTPQTNENILAPCSYWYSYYCCYYNTSRHCKSDFCGNTFNFALLGKYFHFRNGYKKEGEESLNLRRNSIDKL